jgi:hypothetical protein
MNIGDLLMGDGNSGVENMDREGPPSPLPLTPSRRSSPPFSPITPDRITTLTPSLRRTVLGFDISEDEDENEETTIGMRSLDPLSVVQLNDWHGGELSQDIDTRNRLNLILAGDTDLLTDDEGGDDVQSGSTTARAGFDPSRPQDGTSSSQLLDRQLIEQPRAFQSATTLSGYFGFENGRALDKWLREDPVVTSIMKPLLKYRDTVRETTGKHVVEQVTQLMAETAIAKGETATRSRYRRRTDEENWDFREHHAAALFLLELHLCRFEDGRFHSHHWSVEIARNRMWQLIMRLKKLNNQDSAKGAKEATKETQGMMVKGFRDKDGRGRLVRVTAARMKQAGKEPAEEQSPEPSKTGKTSSAAKKPLSPEEAAQKAEHDKKKAAKRLMLIDPENVEIIQKLLDNPDVIPLTEEELAKVGPLFEAALSDDEIWDTVLDIHLPTRVSFKQRMTLEEVETRIHKMQLEQQAAKEAGVAKSSLPHRITFIVLARLLRIIKGVQDDSIAILLQDFDAELNRTITEEDAERATARDAEELRNLKDQTQTMDHLSEDVVKTGGGIDDQQEDKPAITVEANSKDILRLLSNTKFEYSDLIAACKRLNLNPNHPLRLRTMKKTGLKLYWFQICEIDAIRELIKRGVSRGALLGAVVGLGKTYTLLGIILSVRIRLNSVPLG